MNQHDTYVDVWTNTNSDGTIVTANACNDFTSSSHSIYPNVPVTGTTTKTDFCWTNNHTVFCDAWGRLYCFEQ
jgi:hypothetical protein